MVKTCQLTVKAPTYLQPHYGNGVFQQNLPFSWTTKKGKHCWHPIAVMGVVDTFWRYPADITVNHVFITGFPCMSPVLSRWVLQCSAYRPHPDGPSEFYKIMHERTELQFDWLKKLKEYIGTVIRSNRGSCRMRQTVCPNMYLTKGTLVILKMVSG